MKKKKRSQPNSHKRISKTREVPDEIDFYDEYKSLMNTTLHYGTQAIQLSTDTDSISRADWKKFYRACHKGFDRGQQKIVRMLVENSEAKLDDEEKESRELLLRKIADGIAITLAGGSMHVLKRLSYLDKPPTLQLEQIKNYLKVATEENASNSGTFCLISDLTTCIHVGDLIKVEHRGSRPNNGFFQVIELKTGDTNSHIQSITREYQLTTEDLVEMESDPRLKTVTMRKQAKRMHRQNIRLEQAETAIKTDTGIDIKYGTAVRHFETKRSLVYYSETLEEIFGTAVKHGFESATVNYCLHLGVGYSQDKEQALELAYASARQALALVRKENPEIEIEEVDVRKEIPQANLVEAFNIHSLNLRSMCAFPFVSWDLKQKYLNLFAQRKLALVTIIDLPALIWFARKLNVKLTWSTKKQTAKLTDKIPGKDQLVWDNKLLMAGEVFISPGTWSRMLNELMTPYTVLCFIKDITKIEYPKILAEDQT